MDKKLDAILDTLEMLTEQIKELRNAQPDVSEEMSNFVDILLDRAFVFDGQQTNHTPLSLALQAIRELLDSDMVLDSMGKEVGFGLSRNNIGYRTLRRRLAARATRTLNHSGSLIFVGVYTRKSAMIIEKTLFPNGEYSDDSSVQLDDSIKRSLFDD